MNACRIALLAAAVVAAVAAAAWFLMVDVSAAGELHVVAGPVPAAVEETPPGKPDAVEVPSSVTAAPAPEAAPAISADERKIQEVLRAYPGNTDQAHAGAAQVLINLLPSLGEDVRGQATRHICHLLSDREINRVLHLWRNPDTSREVLDILGSDLASRRYEVMLPAMIDAMKRPTHPFRDEARSRLQFLVKADYGNDFARWELAAKELIHRELTARR